MMYVKLDNVLNTLVTKAGGRDRYTEYLLLTKLWFDDGMRRLGNRQSDVRAIVTNQVVAIPPGMTVGMVGMAVDGSIQPLGINWNMLDLRDDCGQPVRPDTGNPDFPLINIGAADMLVETYPWYGWNYGYPLQFTGSWPGQGGGQSVRGYYRPFPDENFILFDKSMEGLEVVLRGRIPLFRAGYHTWVPDLAVPAIEAWLDYKPLLELSKTDPRKVGTMKVFERVYVSKMSNLKDALNHEPLHILVAAVRSRLGQIGVL
jgi:hypothetical protein